MAFSYKQATEIRDAFAKQGVRYLFIGKSGAIILGYPDTTQDSDVYVDKTPENCKAILAPLLCLRSSVIPANNWSMIPPRALSVYMLFSFLGSITGRSQSKVGFATRAGTGFAVDGKRSGFGGTNS